jgi:hypothetical protein
LAAFRDGLPGAFGANSVLGRFPCVSRRHAERAHPRILGPGCGAISQKSSDFSSYTQTIAQISGLKETGQESEPDSQAELLQPLCMYQARKDGSALKARQHARPRGPERARAGEGSTKGVPIVLTPRRLAAEWFHPGLWCGGARPDPLYCVGSSRCPLVLRLDRRPVCTVTGGGGVEKVPQYPALRLGLAPQAPALSAPDAPRLPLAIGAVATGTGLGIVPPSPRWPAAGLGGRCTKASAIDDALRKS